MASKNKASLPPEVPRPRLMLLGGLRYLLPVIESAHRHNIHVITVDYLPYNIAHKYSDEYHNVSIMDKEAVLHLARELDIDGIMSFAVDPGVITAAYVAEQMNLPFQCSYESACILQDKARFREFLTKHGFNVPVACGYNDIDSAIADADRFNWPVIVKPVDSAGSKGVSRVDDRGDLRKAIEFAISEGHNGEFIIEDFLELEGYQSTSDMFSVDEELKFVTYSDQMFDKNAPNPYTPSIEIWPSTMSEETQDYLTSELQRLFHLLNLSTGLYNIEARLCKNGKAYIMEVSPRAGGNRIAEIQEIATGVKLIENEVLKAVGDKVDRIVMPLYDSYYCNYILHSDCKGIYDSLFINDDFKQKYILDVDVIVKEGDVVKPFTGANCSLGTLFLRFDTHEEMISLLNNIEEYIKINVK